MSETEEFARNAEPREGIADRMVAIGFRETPFAPTLRRIVRPWRAAPLRMLSGHHFLL